MQIHDRSNTPRGSAQPQAALLPRFGLPVSLLTEWQVKAARIAVDAAVLTGALLLAHELYFALAGPASQQATALRSLPIVIGVQLTALALGGMYATTEHRVGSHELKTFARAAGVAAMLLALLQLDPPGALSGTTHLPLPVLALDALLAFAGLSAVHADWSISGESSQRPPAAEVPAAGSKVLLVGAGRAGISALQELQRRDDATLCPIGFIDNDPGKQGRTIHGLRVLGRTADLPRLVRSLGVDHVVVTLAHASRREVRRIVEQCERIPVKVRVIPGLLELLEGNVEATIRAVDIEDLLGREPVVLGRDHLTPFLAGKKVLITGAGGSIGSELCRQVARLAPERLILVERCEFALWSIERELRAAFPALTLLPRLADVGDAGRMREIFSRERPQVVLHAAAHKHVPLVESNPCEAIKNNVFGTQTTGELAGEYGAEAFVLVSTDKAVRPTSMMGATKRVAELVVQHLGGRHATRYMAVRFGNVLGSTGSVVPIFREQIARGGPVTITHPNMVRFFMTIPEAAQLVLQAGSMEAAGEIFVLDMGEPVRIVDLATNMIKQCGLKPEDVEIVFSGIRPGEKMYEELSTDDEVLATTRHPKILSGKLSPLLPGALEHHLQALALVAGRGDEAGARRLLARILPESQLSPLALAATHERVRAPGDNLAA